MMLPSKNGAPDSTTEILVVPTSASIASIASNVLPIEADSPSPNSVTDPQMEPTTTSSSKAQSSSTTVVPVSVPQTESQAFQVLSLLSFAPEQSNGYDRDLFNHWITANGCSTRESVLIRDALRPPQIDIFGCKVVEGDWFSPYDGAIWTYPSDLDIDHVVALKEAWDSGAWAWTAERRQAFANDLSDPRTLRAVTDNINQLKSDSDPSQWLPPLSSYVCAYIADWISIKARWSLSIDQVERNVLGRLLSTTCVGIVIDPWIDAPSL